MVIYDIKQPEAPAVLELIMHKIHGPDLIDAVGYSQRLWFLPDQPLLGFDP